MKKILHYCLALFIVTFFLGCKEETLLVEKLIVENEQAFKDAQFQQENFGNPTQANFFGVIRDVNNKRLEGVEITIGNLSTMTDRNGIFTLKNANVYENFAYVKAKKEGFLNGSRVVVPNSEGSNRIDIRLLNDEVSRTITTGVQSFVDFGFRLNLLIPGNFAYKDGSVYEGNVNVVMHYLYPYTLSIFDEMQGNLFGKNQDDKGSMFEVYGMFVVKFFTDTDQEVFIDPNSPATVNLRPSTFPTAVPDQARLWSFDEDLGYWIDKGSAMKQGDFYQAEISGSSNWTIGLPLDYDILDISLRPNDVANNVYVPFRNYIQRADNLLPVFVNIGYSGNESERTFVPKNEDLNLTVRRSNSGSNNCNFLYEQTISSSNSSLNVTFDDDLNVTVFKGTVTDCAGSPLEDGYLYINEYHIYSITNGLIDVGMQHCTNEVVDLQIYDNQTGLFVLVENQTLTGGQVDLGALNACNESGGIFNGDVFLTTQEEINNFGRFGYKHIQGDLMIGGSFDNPSNDIIDLSPLSTIESVEVLGFRYNNSLPSLQGLTSLTKVKNLAVNNNKLITSLTGLENVNNYFSVNISYNEQLNSLQGLSGSINRIFIRYNGELTSLTGLENLTSLETLNVWDSQKLVSISELSNLQNLQNITLDRNPVLASLQGLEHLTSLRWLNIARNNALQDLAELSNVTSIDFIYLAGNQSMTSLNGLENLTDNQGIHIGRYVQTDIFVNIPNPNLTDYCALQNLFSNGNFNNSQGTGFIGVHFINNPFNPTVQDIIDGNCRN